MNPVDLYHSRKSWAKFLDECDGVEPLVRVWNRIVELAPSMIPPRSAGGSRDDGDFAMMWDLDNHHLEVDTDGVSFDWFYRDRSTPDGDCDGADSDVLPSELPEQFKFFCESEWQR